jgi:hypothetical protein
MRDSTCSLCHFSWGKNPLFTLHEFYEKPLLPNPLPALCPTKPHDAAKNSTSPMMPRKTGFLFFQALSHYFLDTNILLWLTDARSVLPANVFASAPVVWRDFLMKKCCRR